MKKINYIHLGASIALCHLAGIFGAIFTSQTVSTWYVALEKPGFNPPSWIFAPVWLSLYTLMGIALYLVWRKGIKKEKVKTAVTVFVIHLILNALWSLLFFGIQAPIYAFFEILILWVFIIWTIVLFFNISRPASFLLMPYFIWVSFAMVLNFYIWQLNI